MFYPFYRKFRFAFLFVFACFITTANAENVYVGETNVASLIFDETGDYEYYFINYDDIKLNAMYANNIWGEGVKVANIEAGLPWYEHVLFDNSNIGESFVGTGALGMVKNHPTQVSSVIAGVGNFEEEPDGSSKFTLWLGIAPKSTLYSGAFATEFHVDENNNESFSFSGLSMYTTYHKFFVTEKVDVINSSWGSALERGTIDDVTPIFNAFTAQNPLTTFVVSAGNNGPAINSVGSPALCFNSITVGAYNNIDKDGIAEFSSHGPSDFYNPLTGETIEEVRAAVDIATSGIYISGATQNDDDPTVTDAIIFDSGTSFSSPIVSGVVALLKDASYKLEASGQWTNSNGRDSRVIKAVLLNSASKPENWNNGQQKKDAVEVKTPLGQGAYIVQTFDNVLSTSQALDYDTGAGLLDSENAFIEYVSGQWVLDEINYGDKLYIQFQNEMQKDWELTATLVWFSNDETTSVLDENGIPVEFTVSTVGLSNLDMEIWLITESEEKLIAISNSVYNTVEHLDFTLEDSGNIRICVSYFDTVYGDSADMPTQTFALAWNVVVPEPSHFAAAFALIILAFAMRLKAAQKKR